MDQRLAAFEDFQSFHPMLHVRRSASHCDRGVRVPRSDRRGMAGNRTLSGASTYGRDVIDRTDPERTRAGEPAAEVRAGRAGDDARSDFVLGPDPYGHAYLADRRQRCRGHPIYLTRDLLVCVKCFVLTTLTGVIN